MSGGEVIHVLSSAYQPNKIANATEIAGRSGRTGIRAFWACWAKRRRRFR